MHNFIFQVDSNPIPEENYLREDCINEGDMVYFDYADELSGNEREEAIEYLVEKVLPKGMFSLNPDYSITYNGGIEEWRNTYHDLITTTFRNITPENIFDIMGTYKLQKAIVNPLGKSTLFVIDNCGTDATAERSAHFMSMVDNLTKGEKLYIGGVCDYHF